MPAAAEYEPIAGSEAGTRPTRAWKRAMLLALGGCAGLLVAKASCSRAPTTMTMLLNGKDGGGVCSSSYSKETLKSVAELAFAAAFADAKGEKKWEASDVTVVNGSYYVVHDSSWAVSKIDPHFLVNGDANVQFGEPLTPPPALLSDAASDSGFEALVAANDGAFYVVRESIDVGESEFRAVILKLRLPDTILEECPSEMLFEGDSKGFEGAASVVGRDGTLYLLGLCEGNHCAEGDKGKERGHGRIVVMAYEETDDDFGCRWRTVKLLDIPKAADFQDYSSLTVQGTRVAISSQEESQLWTGRLGLDDDGFFDPTSSKLATDGVFNFPRDANCKIQYCNIEGIHWVNDHILVAVSDKMKSKGKQHFRCLEKDQSIHLFVTP
mmetsp:Transcript_14232/g.43071  ORF Transcript_14232/g.43071 Transcript_14232/m.43071 type:complete len:382 (-) Transcript_14232:667-1812(-)